MWSVDSWQPTDFSPCPLPNLAPPVDPWQPPVPRPRHDLPVETGEEGSVALWLEELRAPQGHRRATNVLTPVPASLETLFQSLEFKPQARQKPWQPESAIERPQSQARRKAASLAARLEISHARDREAALAFLTELLQDFPHSATYHALGREIAAGADLDSLQAMGDLKRLWIVTPAWWSRRRFCPVRRELEFIRDRQGAHGLSWRLARRIGDVRWRWPVEAMISESWLDEWRALPFSVHRSWSFAQFLDWRLDRDPADDDRDPLIVEASPHGLQPSALMWQEVAASSVPLADLVTTASTPEPDQLQ